MSHRHRGPCAGGGRHRGPGRRCRGPVKRVVRGVAERFQVPRGAVIAGFVVGLVFVPLLTVLLFLAALYWVDHPERAEHHASRAAGWAREGAARVGAAVRGDHTRQDQAYAAQAAAASEEVAAVSARFAALEGRARAIEEYVASEEYRLEREFRRMRGG